MVKIVQGNEENQIQKEEAAATSENTKRNAPTIAANHRIMPSSSRLGEAGRPGIPIRWSGNGGRFQNLEWGF
jgi:hypothetical protein